MRTGCVLVSFAMAALVACGGGTGSAGAGRGGASGGEIAGMTGSGAGSGLGSGGAKSDGGATGAGGSGGASGGAAGGGITTPSGGGASGDIGAGGKSRDGGPAGAGGSARRGDASGSGGAGGPGGKTSAGGTTSAGGVIGAGGAISSSGGTSRGGSSGAAGAAGSDGGAGSGACTRETLQAAVDSYLLAMQAGDSSSLSLGPGAAYTENGTKSQFGQGLWQSPLPAPDLHMSLLDVEKCGTFTEVIIASGSHPYVLGVRLALASGQISAATVIATDCDDWGFNAASYLRYSKAEQTNTAEGSGWGPVPVEDQFTRAELQAAGDAYFAYWADKTVSVPWGYPCSRLEGGMATNPDPKPNQSSTCSVGIPDQSFAPKANDYLIDVDHGMVVLFLNMPGPDSHWFRITKSTLMRYIHTLTVCYVNGAWQCPGTAPTCS